ncbi:UvrD-helicase domain-containing protein [Caldimicrobium thiodismutans]|nr:ATP-dependent helicase [Caldimicrobium thiodismutans]
MMLYEPFITQEQKAVIEANKDLLVIAGPGTGKTYTLLLKIKTLLENGLPPEKILILTFSLKTCQELRERLSRLGIKEAKVDTFHGLAYDLYRDFYQKEPRLIDEKEKTSLLKKLFSGERNLLKNSDQKIQYFDYLEKNGLIDFDLLLNKAISLINPENLREYYLFLDEFQDLSPEILDFLKSFKEATWILFGDPNQSIYGFRGVNLAKIQNFLQTHKPHLQILTLTESFRCKEEILKRANQFKASPWKIPPFRSKHSGGIIQGFIFPNTYEEKDFLVNLVQNILGGTQLERARHTTFAPSDIFILSRIKRVSEPLIEAFQKEGIPVALPEEEAQKLKDEINQIVERIKVFKEPLPEIINDVSPFLKNIFQNWRGLLERDQEKFLFYLKGLSSEDLIFPKLEGVNFLTIHASKGLEAEVVILYGGEEGLIPFTLFRDYDLDEEKRILYVALTRAKGSFYFTATQKRKIFHYELTQGLSGWLKTLPYKEFPKRPPKPKQIDLF